MKNEEYLKKEKYWKIFLQGKNKLKNKLREEKKKTT